MKEQALNDKNLPIERPQQLDVMTILAQFTQTTKDISTAIIPDELLNIRHDLEVEISEILIRKEQESHKIKALEIEIQELSSTLEKENQANNTLRLKREEMERRVTVADSELECTYLNCKLAVDQSVSNYRNHINKKIAEIRTEIIKLDGIEQRLLNETKNLNNEILHLKNNKQILIDRIDKNRKEAELLESKAAILEEQVKTRKHVKEEEQKIIAEKQELARQYSMEVIKVSDPSVVFALFSKIFTVYPV
jgi:chromosome segregation ATPase